MKTKNIITAALALIFALSGCNINLNSSGDGSGFDYQPVPQEKSSKRGIAYDLTDPADLGALKTGLSWWYNWHYTTDAPSNYHNTYQMEFIPMLWGGNSDSDYLEIKSFIMDHPEIKYILVMNEPNLLDQANQSPSQAAREWINYEQVKNDLAKLGREVELVGPAMTWGTMTDYWDPVVWLDAFYEAYSTQNKGAEPSIDYLAFHWYDYGLEGQLDRLEKYGKKIWITEMANWNPQIDSYEKQAEQMKLMVEICENREDVFRYAWFIGRGAEDRFTNLFHSGSGELNDLGKLYISLPH